MKYPRTPHLPFSPGITAEDRVMSDLSASPIFQSGQELVITEKLDGGNVTVEMGGVHARSCDSEQFPGSSWVKGVIHAPFFLGVLPKGAMSVVRIHGECLFAVHSIEYTALESYYYAFALSHGDSFMAWRDLELGAMPCPHVPILWKGMLSGRDYTSRLQALEAIINDSLRDGSRLGASEAEGAVVRVSGGFPVGDFDKSVAKWVRAKHVKTGKHWRSGWQQAKLRSEERVR